MDPKTLNLLKLVAASFVAAASAVLGAKASGVAISQWVVDWSVTAGSIGAAIGIMSNGLKPTEPKPVEPPAPTPPVQP